MSQAAPVAGLKGARVRPGVVTWAEVAARLAAEEPPRWLPSFLEYGRFRFREERA